MLALYMKYSHHQLLSFRPALSLSREEMQSRKLNPGTIQMSQKAASSSFFFSIACRIFVTAPEKKKKKSRLSTFIPNVQTWLAGAAKNISAVDRLIKNAFPHVLIMPHEHKSFSNPCKVTFGQTQALVYELLLRFSLVW